MDRQGPTLRCILETNPEALAIADALDAERRAKGPRGPLHGIPILLKDNVDTHDKMTTTAGSLALEGPSRPGTARWPSACARRRDPARQDQHERVGQHPLGQVVVRLVGARRAVPQPVRARSQPCGSSSGSGDRGGGQPGRRGHRHRDRRVHRVPVEHNGLVGIKPTLGLVSRAGIIPIAHSQDTAGPMARTVSDAAILLAAIAGIDPRDAATADARGHIEADYTKLLDPSGLKGARIGVTRKQSTFNRDVDALVRRCGGRPAEAGAVLVDPVEVPHAGEYDETELEVLLYELKADLNAYLAAWDRRRA
jgi:amidase